MVMLRLRGNDKPMKLFHSIRDAYGEKLINGSMIGHETLIRRLLADLRPETIVEIGTLYGVSTILWAQHAERVITIDLKLLSETERLWTKYGVRDRITAKKVGNEFEKRQITQDLHIDLAFIDGGHTYEAIRDDIEATGHAKALLFHDYKPDRPDYAACRNNRFPGVARAIDELSPAPLLLGPLCSQFALWLNPAHYDSKRRAEIARSYDVTN